MRPTLPSNTNWKATHLSRSEVLELVFGKITMIESECQAAADREEAVGHGGDRTLKELQDVQRRLKRIAIEARRAASLIETHTHVAMAGHCVHCGKTYAEHDSDVAREADGARFLPKKHAKPGAEGPRCLALQRLFDSVELETYQPLPVTEAF